MKNTIDGLQFRTLKNSIKTFEQKGHSYIHLNAIQTDLEVVDFKKVSLNQYVIHLRDCNSKDNYLVGMGNDRYNIIKRWKNDL